jgi:hypothetical protein
VRPALVAAQQAQADEAVAEGREAWIGHGPTLHYRHNPARSPDYL